MCTEKLTAVSGDNDGEGEALSGVIGLCWLVCGLW